MMKSTRPDIASDSAALEDDVYYSIRVIRWFLKYLGAFPQSRNISRADKVLPIALNAVYCLVIVGMTIPCALDGLLSKDPGALLDCVGPMSFWVMAMSKYYLLLSRCDDIRRCVDHMEHDWRGLNGAQAREIMRRSAESGRVIVAVCLLFMYTSTFFYNLSKSLHSDTICVGNDSVLVHMVPLPFYKGIADPRFSPSFEIVSVLQYTSSMLVSFITSGACGIATMLVMHAYSQLEIVMWWLQNFVEIYEKTKGPMQTTLGLIVKGHLRVLSFAADIEEIMHQICMVEVVVCTMNICFVGYYLIMEWERSELKTCLALSIVFLSLCFNIFIFCYIGEILSVQCKLVGETAYFTDWYRLPKETALCFILIICRSDSVVQLTAGKWFKLSVATFGDVIRTAMVYLNMLRTVTS